MNNDRILVFIPCYNCAPQIGRVLQQLQGTIASHLEEVLVLDNGSADGTRERAIEAAPAVDQARVVIARNRENYNLGGSHKAAYAYAERAGYTHVVTLHGDDQGNIADLLPVLQRGDHQRFDACMGARFAKGAKLQNYSAARILGNRLFNGIFSVAARRRITDMGSGLNLLARAAFSDRRLQRLPDDLHFNPYLLLDLIGNGRSVHFFPISWSEDDQVSNVKMVSQALQTLHAPILYTFAPRSFRTRDFRRQPRSEYRFDVIAEFAGLRRT
jgi:glycosyltransferase involved in cell wall biosynthesis